MERQKAKRISSNGTMTCLQFEVGDICLAATGTATWFTHPDQVIELLSWLRKALRYMERQWMEDVVVVRPEDIEFVSEEAEDEYYGELANDGDSDN